MSKYGFNPDEVVTTKIDLIDKDGFHGVGTADGGNSSGGSGENKGSSFLKNIYARKQVDHNTVIIFYDPDIADSYNEDGGWGGEIGWLFVYFGETKELKREYESWAEFVEDVGYDFSITDPTRMHLKFQTGEATTTTHFSDFSLYTNAGFIIYNSDNKDAIDALNDQTINAIGIYGYEYAAIENGDPTCKPTGSFRVSQVSGQFMEE